MTTTLAAPARPPVPAPFWTDHRRAVLAAAVTVVLWASAFVAIRALGDTYAPGPLAFGRVALGSLVLGVFAVRKRRPLPRGRTLGLTVTYGAAWFAGYFVVLNRAAHHLDAGTMALVINVAPILVAVFAGLFLREGFPRPLFVGSAVAFAGIALIALGGSGVPSAAPRLGIVLGLLAALLYATGVVLQKVVLRGVDPHTTTFLGCAVGAVVLLPFAPRFVAETVAAPDGALLAVIYLGLFPTAIAFSTWAYALSRSDAGRLAATTLTVPAIVVALSWVLLGELPTLLGAVGGALCLAGVAISRRGPTASERRDRQAATGSRQAPVAATSAT